MAHIYPDFKTKKAFRDAVASGRRVEVINTSMFSAGSVDGVDYIEAPAHYHKWYAKVLKKDNIVIKIIS